jgi:uncharacterized membrane protein
MALTGRPRESLVGGILAVGVATIATSVIFKFSDSLLLDNSLGGPFKMGPIPDSMKGSYVQAIGQMVGSIADTDTSVTLGLFVAVGLVINFDKDHLRCRLSWKLLPLSWFVLSSILTMFFAIRFKVAFLLQAQFDRIDVELLESALTWHLCCLLSSALSCFLLVLLVLRSKEEH